MRRKPWPLIVLAIFHWMAPFGNILLNAVMSGRDVIPYFVHALSPRYLADNWILVTAPLVAGFAIYKCKKWSFYVYLFALASLFLVSYAGYQTKQEHLSFLAVIFVYLVNIAVVSYFLIPEVRRVYFDRRMRWWEIQARYKCHFKCTWTVENQSESYPGVVENFSANGLFLKTDERPQDGDDLEIKLSFNHGPVLFKGRTIIHDRVDAVGFGVQFAHDRESQKVAKQLVQNLEEKGMRISNFSGRPEDRFSFWLRKLLTTGQGWVPREDETSSLKK